MRRRGSGRRRRGSAAGRRCPGTACRRRRRRRRRRSPRGRPSRARRRGCGGCAGRRAAPGRPPGPAPRRGRRSRSRRRRAGRPVSLRPRRKEPARTSARVDPERRADRGAAAAPDPGDGEQQGRPDEVELLLDRQRPEMQHRARFDVLGEVVDRLGGEVPVGGVERRADDVAGDFDRAHRREEQQREDADRGEQHGRERQQAPGAARVEAAQRDRRRSCRPRRAGGG